MFQSTKCKIDAVAFLNDFIMKTGHNGAIMRQNSLKKDTKKTIWQVYVE